VSADCCAARPGPCMILLLLLLLYYTCEISKRRRHSKWSSRYGVDIVDKTKPGQVEKIQADSCWGRSRTCLLSGHNPIALLITRHRDKTPHNIIGTWKKKKLMFINVVISVTVIGQRLWRIQEGRRLRGQPSRPPSCRFLKKCLSFSKTVHILLLCYSFRIRKKEFFFLICF